MDIAQDADKILLELYCEGDRIGAAYESAGPASRSYSYREIMGRSMEFANGTDEADIVRLYGQFAGQYSWHNDAEAFALAWFDFHERQRAATSYGRTWRDHFQLVKYLRKQSRLDYQKICAISRERDSAGNGCLALAYPIYLHARVVGADSFHLADVIVRGTHHHAEAIMAVHELLRFFHGELSLGTLCSRDSVPVGKEVDYSPLAPGALACAAICAKAETKEAVITMAVNIGGDVDSFLSLALLLWAFQQKDLGGC